jgi:F-type H+-transporting ATPase subunit epsilon
VSALDVTFVTSDRTIWNGQAAQVVVPAVDGSMGVLPRMQPTLAILDKGEIRIISEDGSSRSTSVEGGFMSMDQNVVTIAVDHASRLESAH